MRGGVRKLSITSAWHEHKESAVKRIPGGVHLAANTHADRRSTSEEAVL